MLHPNHIQVTQQPLILRLTLLYSYWTNTVRAGYWEMFDDYCLKSLMLTYWWLQTMWSWWKTTKHILHRFVYLNMLPQTNKCLIFKLFHSYIISTALDFRLLFGIVTMKVSIDRKCFAGFSSFQFTAPCWN